MASIPPDTRAAGQAGHVADHNAFSDVATAHDASIATNTSAISTLQTQMAGQTAQPVLYAQSTAPTYNGNPATQVWIDTT